MRLPGQVQQLTTLAPHPHFPPPAARSPVLFVEACGHRPDGIEGLSKDRLTQGGSRKRRILHLDPLQRRSTNDKLRQIDASQMSPMLTQQRQHIGRSIALGIVGPCAQLVQQREQLLLQSSALRVHVPQLREQRSHKEALLSLPHIFLGSGQFQAMVDEAREGALLDVAGYLDEAALRRLRKPYESLRSSH